MRSGIAGVSWDREICVSPGMVMLDPSGVCPMRYNQLEILNSFLGMSSVRLTVEDVKQNDSWTRCNRVVDTTGLDAQWRKDYTTGAHHLLKMTKVSVTDPHYESALVLRGCLEYLTFPSHLLVCVMLNLGCETLRAPSSVWNRISWL